MTTRRLVLSRSAALVGAASTGLLLPQLARAQSNKIRVGLMLPYTGTFAQLGVAIENGFRMALAEQGGKLGGRYAKTFNTDVPSDIDISANEFCERHMPLESDAGKIAFLHFDAASKTYYLSCHFLGSIIVEKCDLNATIDSDDDDDDSESYKLNRDIYQDHQAYASMCDDALKGRSFEDIVAEYDISYTPSKPFKIYGGQHRVKAIEHALTSKIDVVHGLRIYLNLIREQKVEIARINNTSIAVPNDLLDRMSEQLAGPELRKWCQKVNLLPVDSDFADKRNPGKPTVRIIRTLITNYMSAKGFKYDEKEFYEPKVANSGGEDKEFEKIRKLIDWNDESLDNMGKAYAKLVIAQSTAIGKKKKGNVAEHARKAQTLAVVAAWGFAAGLLRNNTVNLALLYDLPNRCSAEEDPLNAKALGSAKLPGTDPENYRGLGTRSNPQEAGRMLEVFLLLVEQTVNHKITPALANLAIKNYHVKKSLQEVNKAKLKLGLTRV